MSATSHKIKLSALRTARIYCPKKGCGGVVEFPVTRMGKTISCPACGEEFPHMNQLAQLSRAVSELVNQPDGLQVEFVIQEEG